MNDKLNLVFNEFKNNFERRFQKQSILDLGEDSLRYDFFVALMNVFSLKSHDIQVEVPIHKETFIERNTPGSKRKESPQIDLFSKIGDRGITVEFGIFKRNSNINASINQTESVFKILNDMLRLSLNQNYTDCDAYFVCVADEKLIGKKLRGNMFPAFPPQKYEFNHSNIESWVQSIKSAESKFDDRFFPKASELRLLINASLIYDEKILNPTNISSNSLETRIIVYKVEGTRS